jgi:mannose-6-phosphate isomerase-like protein (cupin superfamily)
LRSGVTAEVYYILEGTGKIELNGEWLAIEPGMVVYIEPGTRHRLTSEQGVKTIVVAIPPFRDDDEHFD